jgi:hypothetical protein
MKLNKSFCWVQGRFFQKEPLAAGGKEGNFIVGELFVKVGRGLITLVTLSKNN